MISIHVIRSSINNYIHQLSIGMQRRLNQQLTSLDERSFESMCHVLLLGVNRQRSQYNCVQLEFIAFHLI